MKILKDFKFALMALMPTPYEWREGPHFLLVDLRALDCYQSVQLIVSEALSRGIEVDEMRVVQNKLVWPVSYLPRFSDGLGDEVAYVGDARAFGRLVEVEDRGSLYLGNLDDLSNNVDSLCDDDTTLTDCTFGLNMRGASFAMRIKHTDVRLRTTRVYPGMEVKSLSEAKKNFDNAGKIHKTVVSWYPEIDHEYWGYEYSTVASYPVALGVKRACRVVEPGDDVSDATEIMYSLYGNDHEGHARWIADFSSYEAGRKMFEELSQELARLVK